MSSLTVEELRHLLSLSPGRLEVSAEPMRDPNEVGAYKWTPTGLVHLSPEQYREECAKRAREWEGRDGDPGTRLGYKPEWARPEGK